MKERHSLRVQHGVEAAAPPPGGGGDSIVAARAGESVGAVRFSHLVEAMALCSVRAIRQNAWEMPGQKEGRQNDIQHQPQQAPG